MRPSREALAQGLSLCGLAVLACAGFYRLLALEFGPAESAAAAAALLLLARIGLGGELSRRQGAPLIAGSAAALVAPAVLLPLAGFRLAGGLGLILAAAGLLAKPRPEAASSSGRQDSILWGLAAGAAVAWTCLLSPLLGNAIYAFALVLSASALGMGAACAALARFNPEPAERALSSLAAGLAGVFALSLIRFIGINCAEPAYLEAPLHSALDVVFIAGQPWLVLALGSFLLGLSAQEPPGPPARLESALSLLGPLAALLLIRFLGPVKAAASFACLMIMRGWLLALACRDWRWRLKAPLAAAAAAGVFLAALGRPLADIWRNRLNSISAGGRFVGWATSQGQTLAAYEFATGARLLLRDGVSDFNGAIPAKREAHLAILAHPGPRKILLIRALSPETLSAAASHGADVEVLDRAGEEQSLRAALAGPDWKPPEKGVTYRFGRLRAFLRSPGSAYDVILLDLPAPLHGPRAAFETTLESLNSLKPRLNEGGLVAIRLGRPYYPKSFLRLLRTAQAAFKEVGLFDLPGLLLVVCSDQALTAQPEMLLSRLNPEARQDDPSLETDIISGMPWVYPARLKEADALKPETDDRSRNALPLAEILGADEKIGRPGPM